MGCQTRSVGFSPPGIFNNFIHSPCLWSTALVWLRGKALDLRIESSLLRRQYLKGKGVICFGEFGLRLFNYKILSKRIPKSKYTFLSNRIREAW